MTLTKVAIITKRGVVAFAALLILGIVAAVGYRIWYNYYISTLPPVEEKPNLKFGVLPKIKYLQSNISSSNYAYSIDTETGGFPEMPKIIKVYFIPQASVISLLAPDESQQLANKFDFNSGREILSSTKYKYFSKTGDPFIIDLITGNFNYQKKIATSSGKLDNIFTDQTKLIENFKEFLRNKGILNNDLATGRTQVVYNGSTPAISTSANVSIWPNDLDGLQIVTSSTKTGLTRVLAINASNEVDRYPELNYIYWQIDKTTFATYPLEPINDAFSKLQSGLGLVTEEPSSPSVSITKVSLAYFQSEEYTPYLQPVYVFKGPQFTALVSAVKSTQ